MNEKFQIRLVNWHPREPFTIRCVCARCLDSLNTQIIQQVQYFMEQHTCPDYYGSTSGQVINAAKSWPLGII